MFRVVSLYFLYAYSFCVINAIFVGYSLGDTSLILRYLLWQILPSILMAALIVFTMPRAIIMEVMLYIWATIWNILSISHAYLFEARIDAPSLYIIYTTGPNETKGFLDLFLSFNLVAVNFIAVIVPLVVLYFVRKSLRVKPRIIPLFKRRFAFLLLSVVLLFIPMHTEGSFIATFRGSQVFEPPNIDRNVRRLYYVEYATYISQAMLMGQLATANPGDVTSNFEDIQNVIIIVLETANRNNFSLHGYPRTTNPELEKLDLYVYDDVLAPSPVTYRSLPHMYTFSNLKNDNQIATIYDIFKKAGFETHYFRTLYDDKINYNDVIHLLAERAENIHRIFGVNVDAELLESAYDIIESSTAKKKLLVIETSIAHGPYKAFYPEDFDEYNDTPPELYHGASAQLRNEYDTAIRYIDLIVSDFIKNISDKENTLVIVTGDHGEEVGHYAVGGGRSNSSKFPSCFEVPFFVWVSDDYKQSLNKHVFDTTRPYQNDNLLHSIIDLAHLETPLFKPELSLFNKEYQPQVRYIQNLEYERLKEEMVQKRENEISALQK